MFVMSLTYRDVKRRNVVKVVYKMKSKSNKSNLIIKGTNKPKKKDII